MHNGKHLGKRKAASHSLSLPPPRPPPQGVCIAPCTNLVSSKYDVHNTDGITLLFVFAGIYGI